MGLECTSFPFISNFESILELKAAACRKRGSLLAQKEHLVYLFGILHMPEGTILR